MRIVYSRTSVNYLRKLNKELQRRLIESIEKLPDYGDIKKLKGRRVKNMYRLRVGKYRVIFVLEEEEIKIVDINTRGDIY